MATSRPDQTPARASSTLAVGEYRTVFGRNPPRAELPFLTYTRGEHGVRRFNPCVVGFDFDNDLLHREYILYSVYNRSRSVTYEFVENAVPNGRALQDLNFWATVTRSIRESVQDTLQCLLCDLALLPRRVQGRHGRRSFSFRELGYGSDETDVLRGIARMVGLPSHFARPTGEYGIDAGVMEVYRSYLTSSCAEFGVGLHILLHALLCAQTGADVVNVDYIPQNPVGGLSYAIQSQTALQIAREMDRQIMSAAAQSRAGLSRLGDSFELTAEEFRRLSSLLDERVAGLRTSEEVRKQVTPQSVKLRRISRTFAGVEVENIKSPGSAVDRKMPQIEVSSQPPMKSISLRRLRGKLSNADPE